MDPLDFARFVWRKQKQQGYVFLSWKTKNGEWHDKAYAWPTGPQEIPNKGRDVYFCPSVFSAPRRQKQYALPSVWCHADLDEVVPRQTAPLPTLAWETSPERFQCLWLMDRKLKVRPHGELNQKLTYFTGADKGGWSITKVLRLPGTTSRKYREPWKIRLVSKGSRYTVKELARLTKAVDVTPGSVPISDVEIPDMTAHAVMHKHARKLPKRAKELLRVRKAKVGERSDRLWELECLLLEAGVPPEEALILVRESVWNKFAGQRRELPQLWAEIQKALAQVTTKPDFERPLELTTYDKFMATPIPTELWTVEGIWSRDAHGLIAGEPKSYKSLIATDLAVSVASGTNFLGHFEVPQTGPVIIIQEENTPAMMKDRLEKVAYSRGLAGRASANGRVLSLEAPAELPIFLMNNHRFDLTNDDHIEFLEDQIQRIRPVLIVLDPIYLMTPGVDENSAQAMIPVLTKLLTLKQEYGVGILIVHHYNKPRQEEDRSPGNRISGTNVFYRWFESALYVEKLPQPGAVKVTSEHRGAPPSGGIQVEFDMGSMGELDYHVDLTFVKDSLRTDSARQMLADVVGASPGVTISEAAATLDVSTDRIRRLVDRGPYKLRKGKSDGSAGRPSPRIFPVETG
jgi:hypothetical protein